MDILKYKGYEGTAEVEMERKICRGKILFINDLITYEANSPSELEDEFKAAVEDYLETCEMLNREPQKPLKGQFNVRISPDLHKKATIAAHKENIKLNALVGKAIDYYINSLSKVDHSITINVEGLKESQEIFNVGVASEPVWSDYITHVKQ